MKMDPNRLWAKSKRNDEDEHPSMFLRQHLKDVYAAAERVLNATGDDQLIALGLDPAEYRERLRRCVLLAAAVHDLGKANDHFQGMLLRTESRRSKLQGLRHEWVTVLMLQQLRNWLLAAVGGNDTDTDFAIVEWAVAGHHPAHDHASPPRVCPGGVGVEIEIYTGYSEFQDILLWLKVEPSNLIVPKRQLVGNNNVFAELVGWSKRARLCYDQLAANDKKLVAAVKNCLIAADVAGSALPRALPYDVDRWDWITDSFAAKPTVLELQEIVTHRLGGGQPRHFQTEVANSNTLVTFVRAGCGSGKTLAAYMWAAKNHPTRRLFFCYPTTGTATEGFRDYLHEPDIRADLFHSRRVVDFEIILGTGPDSKDADRDAAIRIDSLDAWSTPIVACTVDTVLGLVQNNKRGLFAWPALAQSAFVFDEIHAYDDRLFGTLLRFLRDLPGLPALLMTASLPKPREEALRETLKTFRNIELNPIAGPKELEELPRYHKVKVENNDPSSLVAKTLEKNCRVLWVCNTVSRVMDAADRAASAGMKPLIYHSRFRYEDRVQRHQAVIEAFKDAGPALAICSQVAEMSLDLSADLLITDLATVPALIQRLGRLNRRARSKADPTKPFVVIEPDGHLPYTSSDLDSAREWLEKLSKDDINQKDLANSWEQTAENPPDLVASAWLDGGPSTTVTELRETSPGISVLMDADAKPMLRYDTRIRAAMQAAEKGMRKVESHVFFAVASERSPKDRGRLILPMPPPPRSLNWKEWPKFKGVYIAPEGTIIYDLMRGAEWQK